MIMEENKNKIKKTLFTTSEVISLVVISLAIGLAIGKLLSNTKIVTNSKTVKDEYLDEFINNYEYIVDNYYEEVDKEKIINSAISGMMDALDDPYSMYFDENSSDNFSITLDGSYRGLGVQIYKDAETGYMIVSYVFKNSPASESGLAVGDKIISLDGVSVKEISATDFSTSIRNSEKNEFSMKVLRDGNELDITLNKKMVVLDSVSSKIFDVDGKKVGYIYIGIFANNTYEQFNEKLKELEKENISHLIIDVRGNSGGHLTAVDDILDLFLSSNQVMYQFNKNNKITKTYGKGKDSKSYKIILLGDETSASASEVLIAGIRENLDSIFIGKKTYGKGTVQELVTLSDGNKYKITVKKWLTPKGNWINDTEGIEPDISVDMDEKYYTSGLDEDDTQLQSALNYIKEN